jgi:hypothetical protein
MNTDALIASLGTDLRPVRRLRPPAVRIIAWLLTLAIVAGLLAQYASPPQLWRHLLEAPDMWLTVLGSILTAIAAAIATFLVALPDRSPRWAWLPVPPLLLWQAANGFGCLRPPLAGLHPVGLHHAVYGCLPFILVTALPLAALLLLMLRRSATLRPQLTTLMAGLAVGSAAASLLWLFHDFDAGFSDLIVHAIAVALVVIGLRLAGPRLLSR